MTFLMHKKTDICTRTDAEKQGYGVSSTELYLFIYIKINFATKCLAKSILPGATNTTVNGHLTWPDFVLSSEESFGFASFLYHG